MGVHLQSRILKYRKEVNERASQGDASLVFRRRQTRNDGRKRAIERTRENRMRDKGTTAHIPRTQ